MRENSDSENIVMLILCLLSTEGQTLAQVGHLMNYLSAASHKCTDPDHEFAPFSQFARYSS